jgi:hypothetical protein
MHEAAQKKAHALSTCAARPQSFRSLRVSGKKAVEALHFDAPGPVPGTLGRVKFLCEGTMSGANPNPMNLPSVPPNPLNYSQPKVAANTPIAGNGCECQRD